MKKPKPFPVDEQQLPRWQHRTRPTGQPEHSFDMGDLTGRMFEIGERIARGETPPLHPAVAYLVTDGAQGETPEEDDRSMAELALAWIGKGAGEALVREYLEESGLSAREAKRARALSRAETFYDETRVADAERERLRFLLDRLEGLEALRLHMESLAAALPSSLTIARAVSAVSFAGTLKTHAHVVAQSDAEAIVEHWPVGLYQDRGLSGPDLPGVRELIQEAARLLQQAEVGSEERKVRLAALLRRPDGRTRPVIDDWLMKRGHSRWLDWVLQRVDVLVRDEAEAENERLRHELEKAHEELGARRAEQLGDRISIPKQLIAVAREDASSFKARLEKIEQGELFPADPNTLEILKEAEIMVEGRQLGHLSTPEVRAMLAVFRVFSSHGDDGRQFVAESVRVPARLLYQASRINPRQPKQCREILQALEDLSSREVYVPLKFSHDGQDFVIGEKTAICGVRPLWRTDRREDAESIMRQWAARDPDAPAPWGGPLPDEYLLSLPVIMRKVWGALVVDGDILQRLEDGAKKVRGEGQGFEGIDWALFLEVTQTTQSQQLGEKGESVRSYVNRDEFITGHYGAERVEKERKAGRYKLRLVRQYERAAQTLLAAGIVTKWTPEQETRRGGRDVFEMNPSVVRGLTGIVERAQERRAQRALPLEEKRPKKRAARQSVEG